jgi:hypothetical protein
MLRQEGDAALNDTRQPKLAENLCRMNYERSSRRKQWRFRRRLRFTLRDFFWLVFCAALGMIIWMDNAHYRHQVGQIRFEANKAKQSAEQKMDEVNARAAYLKMKEQEFQVEQDQWKERLGQLTESPR